MVYGEGGLMSPGRWAPTCGRTAPSSAGLGSAVVSETALRMRVGSAVMAYIARVASGSTSRPLQSRLQESSC